MTANQPFHYWQSGLDYIYLLSGVEWTENEHGKFFKIKHVDELHAFVSHKLVTSPRPLRGQELRFLRSILDMSQAALASKMGLTRDAIAKREAAPNDALSPEMDRLLRFLYVMHCDDPEAFAEMKDLMDDIAEMEYQKELSLSLASSGWEEQDAKAA